MKIGLENPHSSVKSPEARGGPLCSEVRPERT